MNSLSCSSRGRGLGRRTHVLLQVFPIRALMAGWLLATVAGCPSRSQEPDFSNRDDSEEEAAEATDTENETPAAGEGTAVAPSNADSAEAAATEQQSDTPSGSASPALTNPSLATDQAPAEFAVALDTTEGEVIIDVKRAWSPNGADRFYNLVKTGYFTDVAFFRVVDDFMAQVGIHGDPEVNAAWRNAGIQDDPVEQSNTRGMVTFAKTGMPNSRTTQFFISTTDNSRLDSMGFAPFGKVRDMTAVDKLHSGYGDGPPMGRGPRQDQIQSVGNDYLRREFPELDYIKSARILES